MRGEGAARSWCGGAALFLVRRRRARVRPLLACRLCVAKLLRTAETSVRRSENAAVVSDSACVAVQRVAGVTLAPFLVQVRWHNNLLAHQRGSRASGFLLKSKVKRSFARRRRWLHCAVLKYARSSTDPETAAKRDSKPRGKAPKGEHCSGNRERRKRQRNHAAEEAQLPHERAERQEAARESK